MKITYYDAKLTLDFSDEILEFLNIDKCDLLKIDTEGYEYQVLETLGERLNKQNIMCVIAEYGPEGMRAAGHTGRELVKLMLDRDYKCVVLQNDEEIRKAADVPHLPDFGVVDFFFF